MDHTERNWVFSPHHPHGTSVSQDAFGVVSYNILADCHWQPDEFPYCPAGSRSMKDRHDQLMVELESDIESTDVICLQEVGPEYFVQQLQPALLKLGFSGTFFNKQHGTKEGEATFYRNQRFSLLESRHVSCTQLIKEDFQRHKPYPEDAEKLLSHADKDNVVIFSKLYDSLTENTLCVGNIHSTFSDYKAVDVTTLQVVAAFNGLVEFAGGDDKPLIFCGDFNQEPHLPGYQVMHDGDVNEQSLQYLMKLPIRTAYDKEAKKKPKYLIEEARGSFRHGCSSLKSAYEYVRGSEPPFTNFEDIYGNMWPDSKGDNLPECIPKNANGVYESDPEKYGTQLFKATLDYQWFNTNRLKCFRVLDVVDESVIQKFHALPNKVFPSDHVMIKASYFFI